MPKRTLEYDSPESLKSPPSFRRPGNSLHLDNNRSQGLLEVFVAVALQRGSPGVRGQSPQLLVTLRVSNDEPQLGICRRIVRLQPARMLRLKYGETYLKDQIRFAR